jgi:hypothetical protein
MRTSIGFSGWRRLSVLFFAASLVLSGCDSGHGGSGLILITPPNQNQYPPNSTGFAYIASAGPTPDSAGAVYEYAVGVNGTLTPLAQPSIAAGINPSALVVVGNGAYVYVVNAGDGTISQYAVTLDATLQPLSPATVTNPGMHTLGAGATAFVDPIGGYLYVVNTADDNIAQFSIASDGRLAPLAPATVATDVAPVSVVRSLDVSSTGVTSYYVLNSGAVGATGSVSQYTQTPGGALTPTNSAPVAAGTNPTVLAINPYPPSFAYVLSNCDGTQCVGSIRQFSLGSNGALTDTGNIVTTGTHTRGVGMVFSDVNVGGAAYVLSDALGVDTESATLSSFQIGSSGALVAMTPPSQSLAGAPSALVGPAQFGIQYVLTSNSGASANTAATGGSVFLFAEGNGGAPTLVGTTTITAPHPTAIGVWVLLPP